MIKWFNVKDRNGVASLYANNITLNTTAMYPLDTAYKVQVGMDDKNNVVIMPLTKEVVESGALDECCLLKIEFHKRQCRKCPNHKDRRKLVCHLKIGCGLSGSA